MPDLSEFDAVEASSYLTGRGCSVGMALKSLPPKKAESLAAALTGKYRHSHISAVLKGWGHKIDASTIGRHRRGLCSCPR